MSEKDAPAVPGFPFVSQSNPVAGIGKPVTQGVSAMLPSITGSRLSASSSRAPKSAAAQDAPHRFLPLLILFFIGSGCAALIYEIVWFQMLSLIVGSSALKPTWAPGRPTFVSPVRMGDWPVMNAARPAVQLC